MEKRQFIPNTLRVPDAIACGTSVGRVLAGICYFAFVHCGLRATGVQIGWDVESLNELFAYVSYVQVCVVACVVRRALHAREKERERRDWIPNLSESFHIFVEFEASTLRFKVYSSEFYYLLCVIECHMYIEF